MILKTPLKLLIIAVLFAGIAAGGYYFLSLTRLNQDASVKVLSDSSFGWKFPVVKFPQTGPGGQIAYSDIRDPGGIPQGLPVRLKIPVIGVDSAIEDALITPDGRMDVPAGSVNVAWFALGPHPGKEGSAVIGGHFGIRNGVPFVFYNLDKLKAGDKIYIVDDNGDTLAFVVRSIKSFDRNADATTVFTSDDGGAHLNLITCEGAWNKVNDTYPQRLVIFTDAIPAEGAVTISAFRRSLSVGAKGADVAALQTALIQKGLLTMPAGVVKGLFGGLTRSAVAKYQASVGLPAIGVFGPLTRARLVADLASAAALPNAGAVPAPLVQIPAERFGAVSGTQTMAQKITQSVQSLFATPIDALVTSLLLIAIGFMVVMIIK